MRFLLIFAFIFLSTAAFAEQQPTPDELLTQFLAETGQLRVSLAQARVEIAKLREQIKKQEEAAKPKDTK